MGLIDKLFRKSGRSESKLGDFLSQIDLGSIDTRAREVRESHLRVATAISLVVLERSGRFSRELIDGLRRAPVPYSAARPGASFDAATFETAAFIHYYFLAEQIGSPGDTVDDADDEADEGDPFFVAVRDALHLTGGIVNSMASFSANENIFFNRPLAYSMRTRGQGLVEMFEGILIDAVENGAPATLRSKAISLDLFVPLTIANHARAFAATTLPALEGVARNLVEQAAELGLE